MGHIKDLSFVLWVLGRHWKPVKHVISMVYAGLWIPKKTKHRKWKQYYNIKVSKDFKNCPHQNKGKQINILKMS